MYDCVLDPSAKTFAVGIIMVAILFCGGIWIAKIDKNKEIGQRVSLYIKRRREEMGMVSLRFEEYEAVTIRLSKEAFKILQKMQRKGLSPDDAVDSMILAFDKCQSKPNKGNTYQA